MSNGAAPPQDLNVFLLQTDGYLDNNRGILAVSNDDGDWINSDTQVCIYKLSANFSRIPAQCCASTALGPAWLASTVQAQRCAGPARCRDAAKVLTTKQYMLGWSSMLA